MFAFITSLWPTGIAISETEIDQQLALLFGVFWFPQTCYWNGLESMEHRLDLVSKKRASPVAVTLLCHFRMLHPDHFKYLGN